jgi:hypothetical protein
MPHAWLPPEHSPGQNDPGKVRAFEKNEPACVGFCNLTRFILPAYSWVTIVLHIPPAAARHDHADVSHTSFQGQKLFDRAKQAQNRNPKAGK